LENSYKLTLIVKAWKVLQYPLAGTEIYEISQRKPLPTDLNHGGLYQLTSTMVGLATGTASRQCQPTNPLPK